MLRVFILISFILSFLLGQESTQKNFIDTSYDYISNKIESIANFADDTAVSTLTYTLSHDKKISNPNRVDELFKNQKYVEDTEKSFLRLSSDYVYNTKEDNDINIKLSAKLALSKSNKRLKLYMNGFKQNNLDELVKRDKDSDERPEIGISYVEYLKNLFELKYSIGVRSLNPYIRSRLSYKSQIKSWTIEPVQKVEYSIKDKFKEDTKLYLDTDISDKIKFRLEFSRGTESGSKGMDYASITSIFWTPKSTIGLQLSQGFYGNTKYEFIVDELTREIYSGINNYVSTLTFRQNIYRKWLFYEVRPSVNFSKIHDFEPNYSLYFRLDMFFGKL